MRVLPATHGEKWKYYATWEKTATEHHTQNDPSSGMGDRSVAAQDRAEREGKMNANWSRGSS